MIEVLDFVAGDGVAFKFKGKFWDAEMSDMTYDPIVMRGSAVRRFDGATRFPHYTELDNAIIEFIKKGTNDRERKTVA